LDFIRLLGAGGGREPGCDFRLFFFKKNLFHFFLKEGPRVKDVGGGGGGGGGSDGGLFGDRAALL